MQPNDSTYPADWLEIAERDLTRLERALRDADLEQAGFYLQQATEKFLKAYLLSRGWRLRRTHDLKALLDDVTQFTPDFERFREACITISAYYMLERYPTRRAVIL